MDKLAFATLIAWIAHRTPELTSDDVRHIDELTRGGVNGCTPQGVVDMLQSMSHNRKIDSIKSCRSLTGSGLKEAKDLIEGAMHQMAFHGTAPAGWNEH